MGEEPRAIFMMVRGGFIAQRRNETGTEDIGEEGGVVARA